MPRCFLIEVLIGTLRACANRLPHDRCVTDRVGHNPCLSAPFPPARTAHSVTAHALLAQALSRPTNHGGTGSSHDRANRMRDTNPCRGPSSPAPCRGRPTHIPDTPPERDGSRRPPSGLRPPRWRRAPRRRRLPPRPPSYDQVSASSVLDPGPRGPRWDQRQVMQDEEPFRPG